MKSKVSVRQQSHSVLQILNAASIAVIVMFVLSGISLAQGRLPFTGTRTFCGVEMEGTTAIISIGKDGFTSVKTNMWTDEIVLGLRAYRYVTFSGKLNARGILRRNRDIYLEVKSAREIIMMAPQDYITGKLCTSREAPSEKRNDVQRTPAAPPTSASTQTYTEVLFEEVKDLDGLAKSFPFLKEDIDGVITDNKDTNFERTNVYVSDLHQKGMPRLLFIAKDGLYCGAALCSLGAYLDDGSGFKQVLAGLTALGAPVYISTDQLSLLTCGKGGRGEWRFENNAFKPIGNYARSQKLKPC